MPIQVNRNYPPIVSIGMPVYNGEEYIREALDSLLAQTFEDFELIISDNCSTDDTSSICKEYSSRNSRIKYIRQDTNIGVNANFEFVLKQANGDFFMWAACDDYLEHTEYLSVMFNEIQAGYDFCFPKVRLLSDSGGSRTIIDGTMERFSKCVSAYDFCKETIYVCSYQIYGLYNRKFLFENFNYFRKCINLRLFAEGLFVHAITVNSLLAYVPAASLVYRRHGDNTSSTQKTNHLLIDFTKFTFMLLSFYVVHQKFNFVQKLSILLRIFLVHGKYSFILFYGYLTQIKRNLFKVFNLNLSNSK